MRENDHASWITVTLRYHLYVLRKYRKYVSQNFTACHGSSLLATKLDLCFQLGNTASWLSKILTSYCLYLWRFCYILRLLQISTITHCGTLWHKPPSPSFNVDFLSLRPARCTRQSSEQFQTIFTLSQHWTGRMERSCKHIF